MKWLTVFLAVGALFPLLFRRSWQSQHDFFADSEGITFRVIHAHDSREESICIPWTQVLSVRLASICEDQIDGHERVHGFTWWGLTQNGVAIEFRVGMNEDVLLRFSQSILRLAMRRIEQNDEIVYVLFYLDELGETRSELTKIWDASTLKNS